MISVRLAVLGHMTVNKRLFPKIQIGNFDLEYGSFNCLHVYLFTNDVLTYHVWSSKFPEFGPKKTTTQKHDGQAFFVSLTADLYLILHV